MNETLSKYIRAATEQSATAAQVVSARSDAKDIPNPFADRRAHSDGYASVGETHIELTRAIAERNFSEQLHKEAGVTATALWAAQQMEGPSDAVDAALCRLDAKAEREGRYRAATSLPSRLRARGARREVVLYLPPDLCDRVAALAELRGEDAADTLAVVLDAGMTLLDERARRYEMGMLAHLMAMGKAGMMLEAERYLDSRSTTLKQAYDEVVPMHGAPDSIALLVSKFPRAS